MGQSFQKMNFNWFNQYLKIKNYRSATLKKSYNILYEKYLELFKRNVIILKIAANSTFSNYVYTPNPVYGVYKTLIYNEYKTDGSGSGVSLTADISAGVVEVIGNNDVWGPLTDTANSATPTNTALNRSGIWFNSVGDPGPFTFTITVESKCERDLYVGVGTDNRYNFTVNGVTVVNNFPFGSLSYYTSPLFFWQYNNSQFHQFQHWNIYPLHLNKGLNILTLSGLNPDSPSPGYMGLEIYDDTKESIKNAQLDPAFIADPTGYQYEKNYYTNLNMIFSTRYLRSNNNIINGQPFTIDVAPPYNCPTRDDDSLTLLARNIAIQSTNPLPGLKGAFENTLTKLRRKIEQCCSK